MGGPHRGVVKALTSLLVAPHVLPFGMMGERLRQMIMTFATSYQIMPDLSLRLDQTGTKSISWKTRAGCPKQHAPAARGAQFRRELGTRSSVPAISIFGYGLKTIANVQRETRCRRQAEQCRPTRIEPNGDSTILEIQRRAGRQRNPPGAAVSRLAVCG